MICKSCGSEFSEQLPLCPYCAAPRIEPDESGGAGKVMQAARESLAEAATKAKTQAEIVGENLAEAAAKAATKAKAQAEIVGEGLTVATAKATGKVKDKLDAAGGLEGITDNLKRFLLAAGRRIKHFSLAAAKRIKQFARFISQEIEENYDSPKFWADIGVVAFLVLIIIILVMR